MHNPDREITKTLLKNNVLAHNLVEAYMLSINEFHEKLMAIIDSTSSTEECLQLIENIQFANIRLTEYINADFHPLYDKIHKNHLDWKDLPQVLTTQEKENSPHITISSVPEWKQVYQKVYKDFQECLKNETFEYYNNLSLSVDRLCDLLITLLL